MRTVCCSTAHALDHSIKLLETDTSLIIIIITTTTTTTTTIIIQSFL